ncbi:MAG: metallophosphoesterase [Chloroflexi bacterium]|nr:metallophosphoesterase [Chloroflexota bacterium]
MLRLASVSDLHADFSPNPRVIAEMAQLLLADPPDVLIVAGDVSHDLELTERMLARLAGAVPRCLFVAGNHDVWFYPRRVDQDPTLDSWRRYDEELPALCRRVGVHSLGQEPFVVDGVGFAGTLGWYDYSLAPAYLAGTISPEQYANKRLDTAVWQDVNYVAFRDADGSVIPDPLVCRKLVDRLRTHLAELTSQVVRTIVGVTHCQPCHEVVKIRNRLPWDFFSAFMGSAALAQTMLECSAVRLAIYGHTHIPGEAQLGELRVVGRPLGYPAEWQHRFPNVPLDDLVPQIAADRILRFEI